MRVVNTICRVAGYIACIVLWLLMLLTVADVFLRYTFSRPIIGTTEISRLMVVCLTLAMAWCALEGRHIKVDILMDRFSPRIQAGVEIITLVAGLGIAAVMCWQIFIASLDPMSHGVKSSMLGILDFPFYWVLAFSFGILCIAIVALIVQKIVGVLKI